MHLYLVFLLVLVVSFGNGYVLVEGGSVPRRISEDENPEDIQKPLQDVETGDDSKDDEDAKVMKDLEDRFTASLVRLLEQGGEELYKDARFDSIINVLRSTMRTVTGEVDEDYIRKVIETFRKKDEANQRQLDEVMMNQLGFSGSDWQDFLDTFAKSMRRSGPPAASRSPRSSDSAISK